MAKLKKGEKIVISISATVVAVALAIVLLFAFGVFEKKTDYYTFKKIEAGYEVTGYVGTPTELLIPSQFKGKPVVGIADNAFADASKFGNVRTLKLPSTLQYIGNGSFRAMWNLQSVVVPASTKTIGDKAFWGCSALSAIEFEKNTAIESIGFDAFRETKLLRDSGVNSGFVMVDDIAIGAINLVSETMIIPASVRVLGADVFHANARIKTIFVEEGSILQFVSGRSFSEMRSLKEVDLSNATKLEAVGDFAFASSSVLQKATFPDFVKRVGAEAFARCAILASLDFGRSNAVFGENIFEHCYLISELRLAGASDLSKAFGEFAGYLTTMKISISSGVLTEQLSEALGKRTVSLVVEENCDVEPNALLHFENISELEIPVVALAQANSDAAIGKNGFEVRLVGKGRAIDAVNFSCSTILSRASSVEFEGVTSISDRAFSGVSGLKKVSVADSALVDVGYSVFEGTQFLNDIKSTKSQFVFAGTLLYARATQQIIVSEDVRRIDNNSLKFSNARGSLILPATLEEIGSNAVAAGASTLDIGFLADNGIHPLRRIERNAFVGRTIETFGVVEKVSTSFVSSKNSLIFSEIEFVGSRALSLSDSACNGDATNGLLVLGSTILMGADQTIVGTMQVPFGVRVVAENAFQTKNATCTDLILPSTVVYVGNNAFSGLVGMKFLDISASGAGFGTNAFLTNRYTQIIVRNESMVFDLVQICGASLDGNEIFVPDLLIEKYREILPNSNLIGFGD